VTRWWATAAVVVALGVQVGCEMPPRFVRTTGEIDGYVMKKKYRSACVGLQAEEAKIRTYTAAKLADASHVKIANECLCDALYDAEAHEVDHDVAKGLEHTMRDDLAECLAPALADDAISGADRARVVHSLGNMEAAGAYEAIGSLLDDEDPEVRARAAEALSPSREAQDRLVQLLQNDEAPQVRAAAARALEGRKADSVRVALTEAATDDPDGTVRAAALTTAVQIERSPTIDQMVCTAMLKDEEATVRLAAVKAWHGTKSASALRCLDKRMTTEETSGTVRQAILDAVKASPSDEAADMLCRNMNRWARLYIKEKVAPDIEGHNIARAQNDRDFERSYECVQGALRKGGLSCYARNYLGKWMNDLGGKASTPWCPGMVKN